MDTLRKFLLCLCVIYYSNNFGVCSPPLTRDPELGPGRRTLEEEVSQVRLGRTTREAIDSDIRYDPRSHCSLPSDATRQPINRIDTSLRLKFLREEMSKTLFDAVIIPSSDEHQNEYVSPADKRREFITGFSGSSGTAVVSKDYQVLWTDSRYTLQADQQVDCSWKIITYSHSALTPPKWLSSQLAPKSHVGADMRLFGAAQWKEAAKVFNESGMYFEDMGNLFDKVWEAYGRPTAGNGSIFIHELEFAGLSWQTKVDQIRRDLMEEEVDMMVVTALDEVAWLLNLRGFDIPFNPVFRSYAVLEVGEETPIHLFLHNSSRLSDAVENHLNFNNCSAETTCIVLHPYEKIKEYLEETSKREDIKKILVSKEHPYSKGVSYYIYSTIPESKRTLSPSPIMLRKARKVNLESKSMTEAQTKDSVAVVEFFAFLENEIVNNREWNEISVLDPLRKFRSAQDHYFGDSFEPISAFGENGAVVHYVPTEDTKKTISNDSLYLLDSGGQYLDGTTDVTRTLHFGVPTPFQIEAYTRVLQGAIDLASLIVPWGIRDIFVDIIARRHLYEMGLDYGHGTGHGIGLYLSVHEGPTLLAMNEEMSSQIEVGQFFSDEPGYYRKGEFGIRLESILHVVNHPNFTDKWGHQMMQFEVVTLVPFEPKLINTSLLTQKQCLFLNEYHAKVEREIGTRLKRKGSEEAYRWMKRKTAALDCQRNHLTGQATKSQHDLGLIIIIFFSNIVFYF